MYVYVIKQAGRKAKEVKIGKANDVAKRLKQLQTGSPHPLEVYDCVPCKSEAHAFYVESCIQREFNALRLTGEWFRWTANLGNYVLGLKTGDLARQATALAKHAEQVAKGHFSKQ